jgi:hypothetical protein
MAEAKAKGIVETIVKGVVTPAGESLWTKVVKPDTKFNPEGVYEAAVILENEEALKLISKIEEAEAEWQKTHKKKVNAHPYEELLDEEGDSTGRFKFKAKMKASGKYGPRRPALFDSQGTQITKPVEIGNGSTIRIKCDLKGYKAGANFGVTLGLVAVQIINLVEFGGNASNEGFDAVEGGYTGGTDAATEEDSDDWA